MISGTLLLGKLVDEATYVVTARNAAGEVATELTFAVKDTPPVGLAYPTAQEVIRVHQAGCVCGRGWGW